MKLLSMHVDNFGGLHDYSYDFNDGLNIVLQDNGWGKTTMATFLKAMLYGFGTGINQEAGDEERNRYLPWQGGTFGGTLRFEADDTVYQVTRTFGSSSEEDTVSIIDEETGAPADIDPAKIGETLFNLDSNAFQRSVFINQNGLMVSGATPSIKARLNTLVGQASDVNAFDSALVNLNRQIKVYEKNGTHGMVSDIDRQLDERIKQRDALEADIEAQDTARERVYQIDEYLKSINGELAERRQHLDKVISDGKHLEASEKLFEEINFRITRQEGEIESIKSELGGTVPDAEEIDHIRQITQASAELDFRLAEIQEKQEELAAVYNGIVKRYDNVLPEMEQVDDIQNLYGELTGLVAPTAETEEEVIPEGYALLKQVIETNDSYEEKLNETLSGQEEIHEMLRNIENAEEQIEIEKDSWGSIRNHYESLKAETERLHQNLQVKDKFSTERVEPVIAGLTELNNNIRKLEQDKIDTKKELEQETKAFSEAKAKYQKLTQNSVKAQEEADKVQEYAPEKIRPCIVTLGEVQRENHTNAGRKESISRMALSNEEKEKLAARSGDLPERMETAGILDKYRNYLGEEEKIREETAKLQEEQRVSNELKETLRKMNEEHDEPVVEEPGKSSAAPFIILGILLIVAGAALGYMVNMYLYALAALGVILLIIGIVKNKEYNEHVQAYQEYVQSAERRIGIEEKKAGLQKQIDELNTEIEKLGSAVKELRAFADTDIGSIREWVRRWDPSISDISEDGIRKIADDAQELRRLRIREEEAETAEKEIKEMIAKTDEKRKTVNEVYPELEGLSASDAADLLRVREVDHKLKTSRLQSAKEELEKFISECGRKKEDFSLMGSPESANLNRKLSSLTTELEKTTGKRSEFDNLFTEISGLDYEAAVSFLHAKLSDYKIAEDRLKTAEENQKKYLEEMNFTAEQMSDEVSPRVIALEEKVKDTDALIDLKIEDTNKVFELVGVTAAKDNLDEAFDDVRSIKDEFEQYRAKLQERFEQEQRKQQKIEKMMNELQTKLQILNDNYADMSVSERINSLRADVNEAKQLLDRQNEFETDKEHIRSKQSVYLNGIDEFKTAYIQFQPETDDPIQEVIRKTETYGRMAAALAQMNEQRESIEADLQELADFDPSEEMRVRRQISVNETRRDDLLIEFSQKSELIRQTDRSLEQYPDVTEEIHQLYEKKESILNELGLLKKTISLITNAKNNLSERYMGRMEDLFNDYMHVWLSNEAVKGILDKDFNVNIAESKGIHDAGGYSSGESDLMDFCMRLALIDTLFENEKPFLILDDPFVNLDEDRLDKALSLLNAMSASKQIVYFVSHPVRAEEVSDNEAVREAFRNLADEELRIANIQKNSSRRWNEKLETEVETRYEIETGAEPLPFEPDYTEYVIANPVFDMRCKLNNAGAEDALYELFFVDENKNIISNRKLLEIRNGRLSKESLQFALNPMNGGGKEYSLIICKMENDDRRVCGMIPFKVRISA